MRELYELCTKFHDCSVTKCPLDSHFKDRFHLPSDDKKCTCRKSVRLRIVMENPGFNTPFGGYTAREKAGHIKITEAI